MKKNHAYILLALIVLVAVWVRFSPIIWERDMWYDEAFTGILLKAPFGEMNQMIAEDVHPPLYYWLAKPWAAIFGYSPFGIRTFSLACGLAIVVSVFVVAKRMFNVRVGLLASAITAISPFAVEYSQEARMYSLFGLLFLWSVWFFYQALQTNRKKYWVGWAIFSGLSFYTHYLALFFFIMFYMTYVLYLKFFEKKSIVASLLGQKGFWLGVGIIFAIFLTWFKVFFVHMMKGNLGWIGVSYLSDIPKTLQIFLFGHPPGTGGVPYPNQFNLISVGKNVIHEVPLFDEYSIGVVVLSLFCVFGTLIWIKDKTKKQVAVLSLMSLGTLVFLILLSFANIKLYVARYFMPAAILIYILIAGIFVTAFHKKWAWIAVLAIYCGLLALIQTPDYAKGWNYIWVNQDELVGDKIVVAGDPFAYTSARYYFGEDRVRYYNKGNPTEDFSGWVVVGNKNRITDPKDIVTSSDMIVVDGSCDWSDHGIELEMVQEADNVFVCEVVN
ncbi:MAG: glycosyltransferase family 39 protein [Patescibacteria group bacterium]|nr:glycosyltransferase family 39 protein [Patescibacteria group bacterium]